MVVHSSSAWPPMIAVVTTLAAWFTTVVPPISAGVRRITVPSAATATAVSTDCVRSMSAANIGNVDNGKLSRSNTNGTAPTTTTAKATAAHARHRWPIRATVAGGGYRSAVLLLG